VSSQIAAGTGITPAIQLIRRIFHQQTTTGHLPKFKLIYLTRSLQSAYLLDELQTYQSTHPELVSFKLLVDQCVNQASVTQNLKTDKVGRLELSDLRKWVGNHNQDDTKKMILVCGPDR
jgi:ferredoxin-NADP reductase